MTNELQGQSEAGPRNRLNRKALGMKDTERQFDQSRTLQELEDCDWGEPVFRSSLVVACHELRRKPLNQFTAAELRRMIGQRMGLEFLVPIALDLLEKNPLVNAYFYPGDLLSVVLKVDRAVLEG